MLRWITLPFTHQLNADTRVRAPGTGHPPHGQAEGDGHSQKPPEPWLTAGMQHSPGTAPARPRSYFWTRLGSTKTVRLFLAILGFSVTMQRLETFSQLSTWACIHTRCLGWAQCKATTFWATQETTANGETPAQYHSREQNCCTCIFLSYFCPPHNNHVQVFFIKLCTETAIMSYNRARLFWNGLLGLLATSSPQRNDCSWGSAPPAEAAGKPGNVRNFTKNGQSELASTAEPFSTIYLLGPGTDCQHTFQFYAWPVKGR